MKWVPLGIALASLLLIAAGTSDSPRISISPPPELQPFISGNTDFAAELFPRLATDGNLVFSPYSLASVLAVAQIGARGETESQITRVSRFPTNRTQQATSLARIRKRFEVIGKDRHIQLSSSTGVWLQKDYGFEENFLSLARKEHGAEISAVDFKGSSGAVLGQINKWIEKNTQGKLSGAVPGNSVTPETRLIMANAIYFKGQWASRFSKSATRNRPFHLTDTSTVEVPMMAQENSFIFGESDGVQMLVLPYVGGQLHMLVLLPKQGELDQLERHLNAGYLAGWTNRLGLCKVDVLLPRFKITSTNSLVAPLQSLGLVNAFDPGSADFSVMTSRRPLFIQAMEQSTMVEVNEEGTEAAAATHSSFGCAAPPRLPRQHFHADRPFLFLIRENETGTILFVGRVTSPGA